MLSTAASACFSPVGINFNLSLAVDKSIAVEAWERGGDAAGQVDGGACEINRQPDGYRRVRAARRGRHADPAGKRSPSP